MAEKKFQDYTDLGVAPDAADFLLVRDVSDTADSPDGTLKEATVANLRTAIVPVTLAEVSDAGALAAEDTVGTALVDNDAITYAKIQNVSAASRLLGRGDSGAGDLQEITLGSGLSMSGTELSASGAGLPADDTTALVQDPADNTKRARIDVGAVATATTRAIIMDDRDVDFAVGGTFAELSHTHLAADIVDASGVFDDTLIAETSVTQHEAAINHDGLANFVADEHVPHSSVSISAGAGLTGGGTIAATRTISMADMDATTIKARGTASTGAPQDIPVGAGLTLDGTSLRVAADGVTLAMLATLTANRIVGSDGSGNPVEITAGTNVTISGGQISVAGSDSAGTVVATATGALAVTAADHGLHKSVTLTTDQASAVFTIADDTAAGIWFCFAPADDGATVVIEGGAGSINGTSGGTARLINGGHAFARVISNAGTAPIVVVFGDIIRAPTVVSSTKTYDQDDSNQTFVLASGAGTQTFSTAVASLLAGFVVNIVNDSGGAITIDGLDANHSLSNNGIVTVMKAHTKLLAIGSDGVTVLDAA